MIGTIARNDPNTKASTSSAPKPPSRASTQHAGPVAAAALHRQRVKARQVDAVRPRPWRRRARRSPFSRPSGCLRRPGWGRAAGRRRRRSCAGRVRGRRGCGCSRSRPGAFRAGRSQARFDRPQSLLCGGRVNRVHRGQRHHGQQRGAVAAGSAEVARDLLIRDPAFLAGHREFLFEGFRRRSGRSHPHERQDHPEDDHDAFVGQNPAGQRCHGHRPFRASALPVDERELPLRPPFERKVIAAPGSEWSSGLPPIRGRPVIRTLQWWFYREMVPCRTMYTRSLSAAL